MESIHSNPSNSVPSDHFFQKTPSSFRSKDIFAFLRNRSGKSQKPSSFFSENGLSQDIIQITCAEPDICLEVFYALYTTLWPQIKTQSTTSLKDAWTTFIGGALFRGILCPPEKLIGQRRVKDIKKSLSDNQENQVFKDLDLVVETILNLKQKVKDNADIISQVQEIVASLDAVQEVYAGFKQKVKGLIEIILEKERLDAFEALEDLLEPKAIMMGDIFMNHWAYRISRSQARKLLSLDILERPIQSHGNDPSNHRVIALPENPDQPLVYFKANGNPAIQPEKEFMLYSLYKHLNIPVPETALLILADVFERNSDDFYAVQASEAVIGRSAEEACHDAETIFEEKSYMSQVIGALLTNPSDGSFKNFKYCLRYKTLISIDNDLIFKSEFTGEDRINVKSALYLMPQMKKPVPESIKIFFTTLDPHLTILSWLKDLARRNREYNLLFSRIPFQNTRHIYQKLLPQDSIPSLEFCLQQNIVIDPGLDENPFNPKILISRDLIINLTKKLQTIKDTFLKSRYADAQLLFENLSPILGKYYQKLRDQFRSPSIALEALWGNEANGVNYSHLSSLFTKEELNNISQNITHEDVKVVEPRELIEWCQAILMNSDEGSPLDRFVRRHGERRKNNALDLQEVLKELQFLIKEGCTHSAALRDLVDFLYDLSHTTQNESVIQEVHALIYSLPHSELKWLLDIEKYFVRTDQKAPSLKVFGAFMKHRTLRLSEPENQYLFDQEGQLKKNPVLSGRANVTFFPRSEPQFYLKQNPEFPGYESASTLLMRLLGINHLPYQDLLIINTHPILLTQKVDGNPVLRVWHNSRAFQNLDPLHTGLLIISAMLLNPEDGKEDNFILSPDGKYLIPIDNDHCFLPSTFQKEGTFWNAFTVNTALQTKTLLFCLEEMNKPIPDEVKKHVLSIDFDFLLQTWMRELVKIEDRYKNLVEKKQLDEFFEKGTVLGIPLYQQFIDSLHWKVHKIQHLMRDAKESTPFDLLKAIEPFAARCYSDAWKKSKSLKNRFKAATNHLYKKTAVDGSRISMLSTRTMMEIIHVPENNTTRLQKIGPVDALEYLNQIIEERNKQSKVEQELLCELDKANEEKGLFDLFGKSVVETALKEFFADPKEGLALKGSKLMKRGKLKELLEQTPNKGMKIRFLSLPGSLLLTQKAIPILIEGCPNIEYLNLSGCPKLREIIAGKGEWPLLTRLEAKACSSLEKLVCYSSLKVLRVSTSCKIEILAEESNPDIFSIKMDMDSFCLSLKGQGFQIQSMGRTLSNNDLVLLPQERFDRYFEDIKVKIGKHFLLPGEDLGTLIRFLDLKNESLTSEQLQRMAFLKLYNLKRLDLPANVISDEELEILAKGNWPRIEMLNLHATQATKRGFLNFLLSGSWPHLKKITSYSWDSKKEFIDSLIPMKWNSLEKLDLCQAGITSDDIEIMVNKSKWPHLKHLDLSWNDINDEGLALLSQGDWSLLQDLNLKSTNITHRGLQAMVNESQWPHLKSLNLTDNEIFDEGLAILASANWPLLEYLIFYDTKVTLKGNIALLQKLQWSSLKQLGYSLHESFSHFSGGVSNSKKMSLPKIIHALIRIRSTANKKELTFIFLNLSWLNSKEILISTEKSNEKDPDIVILPRGKWDHLHNLHLSIDKSDLFPVDLQIENIGWPSNLKSLNLSQNSLDNDQVLQRLFSQKCCFLEELNLQSINITLQGLEILIKVPEWPNLKKLDISDNLIENQGLEILTSGKWPLLESLDLQNTSITEKGIESMRGNLEWSHLKTLNISNNAIFNEGIGALASSKWPQLECLFMRDTGITFNDMKTLLEKGDWSNLKEIHLDNNCLLDDEKALVTSKLIFYKLAHLQIFFENTLKTDSDLNEIV